jgi:DeoR/GlpR family transcriptional regulator of sugar metabolism
MTVQSKVDVLLKEERQERILTLIEERGKVLACDLSALLEVSEDTIRRDLNELAALERVVRVHGGALRRSPASVSWSARRSQSAAAKSAIGEVAATLVRDGQVILMGGGTTVLRAAESFPLSLKATVITISPPVAVALAQHPGVEVIMIGGTMLKDSLVNLGAVTMEAVKNVRADLCLMGLCAVHPESGIRVEHLEESHVVRALMDASAETAGLVAAEKLNTGATYRVAPVKDLTYLVTDASAQVTGDYAAMGITVMHA